MSQKGKFPYLVREQLLNGQTLAQLHSFKRDKELSEVEKSLGKNNKDPQKIDFKSGNYVLTKHLIRN